MSDLATKKKRYNTLLTELEATQEEYKGKAMPPKVGEEFEEKAKEAEELQAEIKGIESRDKRVKNLERFGSEPGDDPITPTANPEGDRKSDDEIAGYITLGMAVVMGEEYKEFVDKGTPKGNFELFKADALVEVDGSTELFVPLTREGRKFYTERMVETKAVPTIGSGVIEPQRLGVFPKVTADDRLTLRDVMATGRTNSASVEYVREESFTRAAAETSPGGAKPEATAEWTLQTSNVRTIPVWMPVQVQQLADWPQLQSLIDNRLRYDIRKREEEQLIYGDGTAPNLEGILDAGVTGTTDISALGRYSSTGHTTIDVVRIGMTEVRTAGYEPNALAIHPIDWESIVLEKGTDDHYLAQVFPDSEGNMRVWGLRVVETVAVEQTAGNPTEERNLIVGDFRRGAQLLIREDISVMVGMQNDDFTKNLRTILAEERVAFPIYAPAAFAYFETQALATS